MINRDENGKVISCDKISDVTDELNRIIDLIKKATKKPDKITEEIKSELEKSVNEIKDIIALVTPELQKKSNPIEVMNFLKSMVKMKGVAEQLEKLKEDKNK